MPKLRLKFSGMVLKDFPLDKPQLTIGRKMDNDIVIDNLAVSGHHARVVEETGTYFVEDTGSTNGTFVNDMKIAKQRLQPGDQIRVGKHLDAVFTRCFNESKGRFLLGPIDATCRL